jgi:beta-lactamase class D
MATGREDRRVPAAGGRYVELVVGYVEKAKAVHYFSLQIGAPDYGRAYSQRIPIARAILTELGVLN